MFYIEIFRGSRGGNAVPGNETIVIRVYSPNGKERVAITMINPPCYYGNLVVRCTGKKRKEKEARLGSVRGVSIVGIYDATNSKRSAR